MREGFVEHASGRVARCRRRSTSTLPPAATSGPCRPRAAGIAILKWVTSFPGNPAAGLPVVMGAICVSSADGRRAARAGGRARGHRAAHRRGGGRGRSGAGPRGRRARVGIVGCGLHGAWAARCLADAEYGPGVCFDPDPEAAGRLAGELGWEAGAREDALACDVVTCVTPGSEPVVRESDLRPGVHLNMLGADGPGKAEAEPAAVAGRASSSATSGSRPATAAS